MLARRAALQALAFVAILAAETAPAAAAPDSPEETSSSGDAGQWTGSVLDDLIVSAPADENVLMDVPMSALSLSGEYLDDHSVLEPLDLSRVAPGMQVTEAAGFTLIYLRGVGADNFLLGDPSVAYYVDGIYFPFSSALAQEFGAVERVEVLKGPQGTLFGRSSSGGAVNVVTQRPRFDRASISIDGGLGTLGMSRGRLHGNIPLTDRVALSLSAHYTADDYLRGSRVRQNANDPSAQGEPVDPQASRAGRLKLRVKATDDIDLTLVGYRFRSDGPGSHLQLNTAPSPLAAALGVEAQTERTGAVDADPFLSVDTTVAYLGALWDLPWAHLRLLGSDQRITTAGAYDFDGSPQPLVEIGSDDFYSNSRSLEFQLRSNERVGPDDLRWSAGVYYFRSAAGTHGSTNDISVVSNLGAGVLDLLPIDQIPPALLNLIPSGTGLIFGRLGTESLAFMTQATADLTDMLSLTLGARYQEEERHVLEAYNAMEGADGEAIPFPYSPNPDELRKTTYSFDPKLSFELRFDERLLTFLSYPLLSGLLTSIFNKGDVLTRG